MGFMAGLPCVVVRSLFLRVEWIVGVAVVDSAFITLAFHTFAKMESSMEAVCVSLRRLY